MPINIYWSVFPINSRNFIGINKHVLRFCQTYYNTELWYVNELHSHNSVLLANGFHQQLPVDLLKNKLLFKSVRPVNHYTQSRTQWKALTHRIMSPWGDGRCDWRRIGIDCIVQHCMDIDPRVLVIKKQLSLFNLEMLNFWCGTHGPI